MVVSAKLRHLNSSSMIWRSWVTESSSSATQTSSDHLDCRLSNTRTRLPQSGFVQVGEHPATALAPPLGRKTLGPYRKCPGVKRRSGAPQRSAGALSIRALEGSRWHDGAGALMLWVLNVG